MSLSESATYPNEAYGPIRGDTMGTAGAVPDTSIPTMGGKRNEHKSKKNTGGKRNEHKSKKNTGGKRNERKSKKNTGGKRNERKSRRNQRNSKRNHRK
jgi:hypothetical protein